MECLQGSKTKLIKCLSWVFGNIPISYIVFPSMGKGCIIWSTLCTEGVYWTSCINFPWYQSNEQQFQRSANFLTKNISTNLNFKYGKSIFMKIWWELKRFKSLHSSYVAIELFLKYMCHIFFIIEDLHENNIHLSLRTENCDAGMHEFFQQFYVISC